MLSKRKIKYFKSLQLKKYRIQERMFLVEGSKGVTEALGSKFKVKHLLATESFLSTCDSTKISRAEEVLEASEKDLEQVGSFKSNNAAIAVVEMPENHGDFIPKSGLVLALDDVRDPGNLGTIIRIADWYGIKDIICSEETADVFNPKVVNATMGSFTRVNIHYQNLMETLAKTGLPVYGALLSGESIYDKKLAQNGIVLMGNESKGISDDLLPLVSKPIKIPGRGGAESLNVAIATAVVLDNFFR